MVPLLREKILLTLNQVCTFLKMLIYCWTLLHAHGQLLGLIDTKRSDGAEELASGLVAFQLTEAPYTIHKGVKAFAASFH